MSTSCGYECPQRKITIDTYCPQALNHSRVCLENIEKQRPNVSDKHLKLTCRVRFHAVLFDPRTCDLAYHG